MPTAARYEVSLTCPGMASLLGNPPAGRLRIWGGVGLLVALSLAAANKNPLWAPLPVLGLGLVWLAVSYPLYLWATLLAVLPLAVELAVVPGFALTLPSDVFALALLPVAWLLLGRSARLVNWGVRTPLGLLLVAIYVVYLVSTVFSTEPVRSLKFVAMLTWQAGAFLLFPLLVFERWPAWRTRWVVLLVPGTLLVTGLITLRHARYGLSFDQSSFVVRPFFFDHGPYATFLAFLACFLTTWALVGHRYRVWALLAALPLVMGVVFSFSRASWLGLVLAGAAGALLWGLRTAPRVTVIGLVVVGGLFGANALRSVNEYASGGFYKQDDLWQQFRSSFATRGNASNEERINRWVAARNMLQERPWTGFGPNSYSTQYDRFQQAYYGTVITTHRGDVGGAHSEIMTAAAELGWPGLVLSVAYLLVVGFWLVRGYLRAPPALAPVYLCLTTALVSYFPQFAVNYLIDQDEISAMVFLSLATLVSLEYQRRYGSPPPASGTAGADSAARVMGT